MEAREQLHQQQLQLQLRESRAMCADLEAELAEAREQVRRLQAELGASGSASSASGAGKGTNKVERLTCTNCFQTFEFDLSQMTTS